MARKGGFVEPSLQRFTLGIGIYMDILATGGVVIGFDGDSLEHEVDVTAAPVLRLAAAALDRMSPEGRADG